MLSKDTANMEVSTQKWSRLRATTWMARTTDLIGNSMKGMIQKKTGLCQLTCVTVERLIIVIQTAIMLLSSVSVLHLI